MAREALPRWFVWRRLQSLAGLWLVLFLFEHLLTNSQAALIFGQDARGFINGANFIYSLPYLPVIEIVLLGVPILVHVVWGIVYLFDAHYNSFPTDGSKPSLPMYPRNKAYTWQRITAWLLVIGIAAHVYNMRFLHYPQSAWIGNQENFMVKISVDPGLYTLGERLDYRIFSPQEVQNEIDKLKPVPDRPLDVEVQKLEQQHAWVKALAYRPIKEGEAIAVTKDFGTAELLAVRNNFKTWPMIILYTIFVIAAVYHAFNGLWTFLITWGVILTATAQTFMLKTATVLMIITGFLGLSAIWFTYWINLKT